jgi:hypothetical protein
VLGGELPLDVYSWVIFGGPLFPPRTDILSPSRPVRKVPILLQKSKIERRQKSRESRFLGILSPQGSLAPIRRSVVVFA